jgi:1-acyl-sn-glycerol-3-phosphate acyltransferase
VALVRNFLSLLRSIFIFDLLIYCYTVVLGTLSLLSSLFDRGGRIQHGFARLWSWLILKTIACPVSVIGLDRIDTSRPHLYCVNHLSALDIPVLYVHLPFQFRIMAKKELFRYPFLGWHLRRSGQISVDQENARAALKSLNQAVALLKRGVPLVIFPEGGRSANGHLQPFMSGGFFSAIKAGVDVVPMAIVGTYEALKMNTFHIRPRPLQLVVGEPISSAGYSLRESDKLAEVTRNAIAELYYARASVACSSQV